jgi:hypothetical protein
MLTERWLNQPFLWELGSALPEEAMLGGSFYLVQSIAGQLMVKLLSGELTIGGTQ